ncbi:hypothetical protein [Streptomyces sp. NPDC054834]
MKWDSTATTASGPLVAVRMYETKPPIDKEHAGYRPQQWARHPKWATCGESAGER